MQAEHQLTQLTSCTQLSDSFGPPAFAHKASLSLLPGCIYRHFKWLNVCQKLSKCLTKLNQFARQSFLHDMSPLCFGLPRTCESSSAQAPESVIAGSPCSIAWYNLDICANAHSLCVHVTLNHAVYRSLRTTAH